MDAFYAAPPVTRTLTAAVVVTSCCAYTSYTVLQYAYFDWQKTFLSFPPQFWRLVTAFLVSTPKLGIILDPYFLYMNGKTLETGSQRFSRKADFLWYIIFNMVVLILLCGGLVGNVFFLEALSIAFTQTSSQDNPRAIVGFVIIQFEARFMPLASVAFTFLTRGPFAAYTAAMGIVSAHLFDFLTRIWPRAGGGRNWIQTPPLILRVLREDQKVSVKKDYGTAIHSGPTQSSATSTGASSNWGGRGQRLGGD